MKIIQLENEQILTVPDDGTPMSCCKQIINAQNNGEVPDTFHLFSLSCVLYKWRNWFKFMPKIHPFYAVKANPDPVHLRLLAMLGANFDCASKGEIELVLSLGVAPERIIFANTCKPITGLKAARKGGVDLMTVDNEDELTKIKEHFPEARLVIRIQIGDPTALVKLSKKFGIEPENDAPELLKKAVNLGLNIVGISFHVGGMCKDTTTYERAIFHARQLFDIGLAMGQRMTLVDIGGGFPGYCNDEVSLEKISKVVNASMKTHFGDWENVTFIAEPGRYFSMPSSTVCAQVFAKRQVKGQDVGKDLSADQEAYMYYITDGVFSSFNCVPVYKIRPPFVVLNKDNTDKPKYPTRIWGPTCDSADVLFKNIDVQKLDIGDWLMFEGMGAYSRCIASTFNGFDMPKVYYVVTESDREYIAKMVRTSHNQSLQLVRPVNLKIPLEKKVEDDSAYGTPDDASITESDEDGVDYFVNSV